jgi:hypothetical protein
MTNAEATAELDEARALRRECDALLELLPTRPEQEQDEWLPIITAARELAMVKEVVLRHVVERAHRGGAARGAVISSEAAALRERISEAQRKAIAAGTPLTQRELQERFVESAKSVKTVQRALRLQRRKAP